MYDTYHIPEFNKKNSDFKKLYDNMINEISLEKYGIIVVTDISFMVLSYYLPKANKKQIIVNIGGFIPDNENDLNKLISKNLSPTKKKYLIKAFNLSSDELKNNISNLSKNKLNIKHFIDKTKLSKKIIKQLTSYGTIKKSSDLFTYLESILSSNIGKTIKKHVGGTQIVVNPREMFGSEELNDDDKSSNFYETNSLMWKPAKFKSCKKYSLDEDDPCMIDMGRHIQHTFNCYSYFLNTIHNDLIDVCIQQTDKDNMNESDRCRNLWPQPGDYSNSPLITNSDNYTCKNLVNRVLLDYPEILYIPACDSHKLFKPHKITKSNANDDGLSHGNNKNEPLCDGKEIDGKVVSTHGNNKIINTDKDFKCPKGYYKGALASAPGRSYHFYRKDRQSKTNPLKVWSHKDGSNMPKKHDASKEKNEVKDPLTANRNYNNISYSDMCGYFCVPKKKSSTKIPYGRYKKLSK
jgi:hypothetical protein